MNYDNAGARVASTSKWECRFDHTTLSALKAESETVRKMNYGVARRERLLALLKRGFRVCLDFSHGGSWSSKDKDVKHLLKKNKVMLHKQYEHSAVTEHKSHNYLGIV